MLHNTHGISFVCNSACVLLIEYILIGKHCLQPFKKLNDLILYLPCWSSISNYWLSLVYLVHYKVHPMNTALQWKKCYMQQLMKGFETGVCQNR